MIDKNEFGKNLENSINELLELADRPSLELDNYTFLIKPVIEEGKKYNSKDEYIRLWVLNDANLTNRILNISDAISLLTCMDPYFPLWIKVRLKKGRLNEYLFELETSLRFRSPTVIMNQKMKYPPFIVA